MRTLANANRPGIWSTMNPEFTMRYGIITITIHFTLVKLKKKTESITMKKNKRNYSIALRNSKHPYINIKKVMYKQKYIIYD